MDAERVPQFPQKMVLEGGSIHVDGEGIVIQPNKLHIIVSGCKETIGIFYLANGCLDINVDIRQWCGYISLYFLF